MDINLGMIDITKKVDKPQLFLARNSVNREIIANIVDFYDCKRNLKLGNVSELSFVLPYNVDIDFRQVENPVINLVKEKLLIKFVRGTEVEWYVIDSINEQMNEDGDNKSIQAYSLQYEMSDKLITDYNTKPTVENICYNLKEYLKGKTNGIGSVLNNVIWTIGGIDNELLYDKDQQEIKRSFNVSGSKNVLEAVFDLAKTFDAVILYDTEKRLLYFKKEENVGIDRGLTFSYNKYLKTLSKEIQGGGMVSSLKVFGKDGISISSVNPTASDGIEDYSHFMDGYNKEKGTHSPYMSDSLCEALLNYKQIINNNKGKLQSLLGQKNALTQLLSIKQNIELVELNTELAQINADIDINQSTGTSINPQLLNNKIIKAKQIEAKNTEINNLQDQINNIDTQAKLLQQVMSLENNLTPYQLRELNPFIIEKEFRDETYTEDVIKDLYFAGVAQFESMRKPKMTIKIDIVDFLEIIECQNDWDKLSGLLNLGDTIWIKYNKFYLEVSSKIIEMEFNYEDKTINLTIANVKDIETKEERISRLLYSSIGTSVSVNSLTNQINAMQQNLGNLNDLINKVWDTAEREILSGLNNTVAINARGITTKPSSTSSKILRINAGNIFGSNQGN